VTWYSSNYERADPTDNNLEMSFASWIGLSGDPDLVVGGNTNTTFWLAVNFLSATRASVNLTFVDMFSRQRISKTAYYAFPKAQDTVCFLFENVVASDAPEAAQMSQLTIVNNSGKKVGRAACWAGRPGSHWEARAFKASWTPG
jgi:hypothetical protein